MRTIALVLTFNLCLVVPAVAAAAPSNISKPKSTSHVNRVVRNNPAKTEPAMRGRLRLAQDAMAISKSQYRAVTQHVANTDKAHEVAQAENIAASAAYNRIRFDARTSQKDKDAAKAAVDKTRAARNAARTRYRNAQAMEVEIAGQVRQNTAVSMALRRGQWDLVDANQASRTPMTAPPRNPGGGN